MPATTSRSALLVMSWSIRSTWFIATSSRISLRTSPAAVRGNAPVLDPAWESDEVGLEEMVLAYMGQDAAPAESHLTAVGEEQ